MSIDEVESFPSCPLMPRKVWEMMFVPLSTGGLSPLFVSLERNEALISFEILILMAAVERYIIMQHTKNQWPLKTFLFQAGLFWLLLMRILWREQVDLTLHSSRSLQEKSSHMWHKKQAKSDEMGPWGLCRLAVWTTAVVTCMKYSKGDREQRWDSQMMMATGNHWICRIYDRFCRIYHWICGIVSPQMISAR